MLVYDKSARELMMRDMVSVPRLISRISGCIQGAIPPSYTPNVQLGKYCFLADLEKVN